IGGGYQVTTIAVPFGDYPADESLIASGEYNGKKYAYTAALALGGNPAPSPFSTKFNPLHIPRIAVTSDTLKAAIDKFKKHPELRYISDGDPAAVSAPAKLAAQLGNLRDNLGRPVVRY
ncbi:MAG: hypothetical protein H5T84_03965, partial [Thermoleophilia bacterium]|nr:hypothetical protein [Thermoleophilia bacterium]